MTYFSLPTLNNFFQDCGGGGIPLEISVLQHCQDVPGVVRLLDWYERANGFMIVMERPEPGQDLFDYITHHGPLTEDLAKNFFKQVMNAEYCDITL